MKIKLVTLASLFAIAFSANASVTYDEEGFGFVGKGDIQSLFGWNNHDLQANAESLQFRMLIPSGATWKCAGNNPAGKWVEKSASSESQPIDSGVSVDARKNKNGQVTGFMLNGIDYSEPQTYTPVGECTPPNIQWTNYGLVSGSIEYAGENADIMLQVSLDGSDWQNLPITE